MEKEDEPGKQHLKVWRSPPLLDAAASSHEMAADFSPTSSLDEFATPVGSSGIRVDELEIRTPTKKSKKNKKQSKSPAPGFDLTKKPGEEKNHVFSFMQPRPELQRAVVF